MKYSHKKKSESEQNCIIIKEIGILSAIFRSTEGDSWGKIRKRRNKKFIKVKEGSPKGGQARVFIKGVKQGERDQNMGKGERTVERQGTRLE